MRWAATLTGVRPIAVHPFANASTSLPTAVRRMAQSCVKAAFSDSGHVLRDILLRVSASSCECLQTEGVSVVEHAPKSQ